MEHDLHMYRVWKAEPGIAETEARLKADWDQAYGFTVLSDEKPRFRGQTDC